MKTMQRIISARTDLRKWLIRNSNGIFVGVLISLIVALIVGAISTLWESMFPDPTPEHLTRAVAYADKLLDVGQHEDAMVVYEGIYEQVLESREPEMFANMNLNIGRAHNDVAQYKGTRGSITTSLFFLEEARRVFSKEGHTKGQRSAEREIGRAYRILASNRLTTHNATVGLSHLDYALAGTSRVEEPIEYARILQERGLCFLYMAEVGRPEYLDSASVTLSEAAEVFKEQDLKNDLALSQLNLASVKIRAAEVQNGLQNIKHALEILDSNLADRDMQEEAYASAKLMAAKAQALWTLASIEYGRVSLNAALEWSERASHVLTRDKYPIWNASLKTNLILIHSYLSNVESSRAIWHLRIALTAAQEATLIFSLEESPIAFAKTRNNLGIALMRLWEVTDSVVYLRSAASIYKEVSDVFVDQDYAVEAAKASLNAANIYIELAKNEDFEGNINLALNAINSTIGGFDPKTHRSMYGLAHLIRGNVILQMVEKGDVGALDSVWNDLNIAKSIFPSDSVSPVYYAFIMLAYGDYYSLAGAGRKNAYRDSSLKCYKIAETLFGNANMTHELNLVQAKVKALSVDRR